MKAILNIPNLQGNKELSILWVQLIYRAKWEMVFPSHETFGCYKYLLNLHQEKKIKILQSFSWKMRLRQTTNSPVLRAFIQDVGDTILPDSDQRCKAVPHITGKYPSHWHTGYYRVALSLFEQKFNLAPEKLKFCWNWCIPANSSSFDDLAVSNKNILSNKILTNSSAGDRDPFGANPSHGTEEIKTSLNFYFKSRAHILSLTCLI